MFSTTCPSEDEKYVSHFQVALSCISQSLKAQIINRSYDEVAICFFNTREKKNLQDLNGVYVFNVADHEDLDRPTARSIKEFDCIEETFSKEIGSQYGISPGSRDNSLYNALWVVQGLLRKGSPKTTDKRILLFTNEDDPFGNMKGVTKIDMMRTTMQRAKDAQDLGIAIELLPLSRPDEEFNVSLFYAELLGLEGDQLTQFKAFVGERFEDMKEQLRKRIFKKRKIRRVKFIIANGISKEVNTYALIRPTNPRTITWLDLTTNLPLKTDRSFICADTGALVQEPPKRFQTCKNENVMFTVFELSEIKRVSTGHLRLLGFKPLSCLKEYDNLKPSTFIFPSDEDEIINSSGQVEPPGMHMIYLPYSDDIRHIEELHADTNVPHAADDQVKKASALVRCIDLKDFSVCQFSNPALQRHYAVVQALALDEDEMPDIKDETIAGYCQSTGRFPSFSIYGENYEDEIASSEKVSDASRKRKAIAENAIKEYTNYDWPELADTGKLKDLTVAELKYYLTANNLPVTGNKSDLISRILTHGKMNRMKVIRMV